jgi:DNA-binding CsgD family transcriptional regulator
LLDPGDPQKRNFFYFCVSFALWSFCYIVIASSSSTSTVIFWQKAAYAGALTYEVFILRFFLDFTGVIERIQHRKLFAVMLWIVPALFLHENFLNNTIAHDFPDGFWYIGLHVLAGAYNFTSLALLYFFYKKSNSFRIKKQVKIIFTGGFVTILITVPTDFFMGLQHIPTLTPVLILIWISSLFYALVRYKFLVLSPEMIAREVFSHIDELVILFDPEGRVIKCNSNSSNLPGKNSLENLSLNELFTDPGLVRENFKELFKGKIKDFNLRLSLQHEGIELPLEGRFSRIRDEFNDILGILFIGKEVKGIQQVRNIYRLTLREVQIVELLLRGKVNREIADTLNITSNTIKAHITNIYNKCGVNTKLALMDLMKQYELV